MTQQHHEPAGSGHEPGPAGPSAQDDPQSAREKEEPVSDEHTNDEHEVRSEGDDAFGGAVGDDLPGKNGGEQPQDGMPADPFTREEQAVQEAEMLAQEARNAGEHPDTVLAAERLADLQRLQAEYVNYKKRVDRDKATHRELGQASVVESLMPVLDEIHLARQHGDLEDGTPFAKIAAKIEDILGRQGLVRYGEPGEAFDPNEHEALMHVEAELPQGATGTTIVQVLQPGYRLGERIVRPARVSVADPA